MLQSAVPPSDDHAPAKPPRAIVLVGLMGVGKSTVGRRLAARLRLPFVDADHAIEEAAGMTVAEIFERFSKLIDPVCKTARDNKWDIRWSEFDKLLSAAKSALGQQQFAAAIRDQLRAITFLMQEIRDEQNRS